MRSVLPVVTKCKLSEEDPVDLDYYRKTVKDQLTEELSVELKKYTSYTGHRSTLYSKPNAS